MPHASSSGIERIVRVENECDIVLAQVEAMKVGAMAKASRSVIWAFATAVSEAASNALRHGGGGELILRFAEEEACLQFEATDRGPGFIAEGPALKDGFSTLRDEDYPSRSGGLGSGLPAIFRLMDWVTIASAPGRGARVLAGKRACLPAAQSAWG